jgi:hypothetical protein
MSALPPKADIIEGGFHVRQVPSADVLCALEKRVPILCLRPRLEVVEGDVGELTAERCAIDRVLSINRAFSAPAVAAFRKAQNRSV